MFINRKIEKKQLEDLYNSGKAELYVLYGRRRVGKTELLREFCKEKQHVFFIATMSSDRNQLVSFSSQVFGYTHREAPQGFSYPSWEAAFLALKDIPMQPRPVIVLDEFTYLINGNKAIPSILQKVWDESLKNTQLMLIICGSYIGMMETEVLGYRAPLYGRRTASFLLKPLDLPSSALFFPNYSPDDQFLIWAILGGMPYYLLTFNGDKSIIQNIQEHILNSQTGNLFHEPRLLLMEELREPRNYFSILRAIAMGRSRLNEIVQASGVGSGTSVIRYLDILQQMHLITRRVPETESNPAKSKKGIYQIDDHFLRFWFRYVHPNQSSLDLGLSKSILERKILPDLDHFVSTGFEEASKGYIGMLARKNQLAFLPERIGGWWSRHAEIDVLAINNSEKIALIGECKWSKKVVGLSVLRELREKGDELKRYSDLSELQYALFSRSGFSQDLLDVSQSEGIKLVTVNDLVTPE